MSRLTHKHSGNKQSSDAICDEKTGNLSTRWGDVTCGKCLGSRELNLSAPLLDWVYLILQRNGLQSARQINEQLPSEHRFSDYRKFRWYLEGLTASGVLLKNLITPKGSAYSLAYPSAQINKRRRVLIRDNYRCLRCGTTSTLTLDHIVPKSQGGKFTMTNLQTLCEPCNQRKANNTIDYRS